MKNKFLLFSLLLVSLTVTGQPINKLISPSGNLSAEITVDKDGTKINLSDKNGSIVQTNAFQFTFEKNIVEGEWLVTDQQTASQNQTWTPVYGERKTIADIYNELTLSLASAGNNKNAEIIIRLYDEGLALKYQFDNTDFWGSTITDEQTSFKFTNNSEVWATNNAQTPYSKMKISELNSELDRPLVIKANEQTYLAIGEAGLVDFARMKLKNTSSGNTYQIKSVLSGPVNLDKARYTSPWRYIMVANSPGQLLENNYLILNLNEPNQIKNTSWIKPGKVIREVTLTTLGGKACVDLAVRNNIEYVEFDAGWYGLEYSKESDASTVTLDTLRSKGPLDLQEVINYANEKGVGIILYVNMNALEKQLDQILPLYKKWGVKGLKYGFVNVGSQQWTSWLHNAVRKAAKYELMVDIHDEYRPTGYSRTYPNLITQEGIRGDEEGPALEQALITLFTRMIAGAGDYTNCYYAPRVYEKMGGKAAQMAKAIMIYSPWQFIYWYDRPANAPRKAGGAGNTESIIIEDESTLFYKDLPTVWDNTKVLEGAIGTYAAVARQSGSSWYVGVLNASGKTNKKIDLSFLDPQKDYTVTLYSQNQKEKDKNKINIKKTALKGNRALDIVLEANSGCALVIKEQN